MKPMRSMRERVSEAEWDVRVNLAACYRLVAKYGMTDLIYNHITARVPGPEHHILISGYGMLYEEVTASSLIKVDLAGNIVEKPDHGYSVNAAGYIIHSAVHEAREDAHCVVHTHTPAGISVSALEEGLLPLSQTAMRFHGTLRYHDYEGPAFNRGEKQRLVAHLGRHNAMILRNHGLLACGPSIPQAFNLIYWLEQACRIQVQILSCQRPLHKAKAEVGRAHRRGALRHGNHARQRIGDQSAPQGRARKRRAAATACSSGPRCCARWTASTRPIGSDQGGFEKQTLLGRADRVRVA
jgi:ribulose-5-phosphate 4-epimerase/fuculose-1-phosphate aldolase